MACRDSATLNYYRQPLVSCQPTPLWACTLSAAPVPLTLVSAHHRPKCQLQSNSAMAAHASKLFVQISATLAVNESAPFQGDQFSAASLPIPTVNQQRNLDRVLLHTVVHSSVLAQVGARRRPDQH